MFVTIGLTFYTSRVVLENLGVQNYGIYNAVGGVAVMFTFISNSLSAATQRYITFGVGKQDVDYIAKVFSMAVNIHIVIAVSVALLSEGLGIWLIYHVLSIPSESLTVAVLILQFTLLTIVFNIINVPYTACIIAEERMSFFALVSVLETFLKLGTAFAIQLFSHRLFFYGLLMAGCSLVIFAINRIYCMKNISGFGYNPRLWDNKLFREMATFFSWNMMRNGATLAATQGNTILINMFGGPIASAAIGLNGQISSGLTRFMSGVQTAFNPQITKCVAKNETESSLLLTGTSTKVSTYLLMLLALPIFFNMNYLLSLWLSDVPTNTGVICSTGLLCLVFDVITMPVNTLLLALGKIKHYQIGSAVIWVASLPIAYISLNFGLPFKYILIVKVGVEIIYTVYIYAYLRSRMKFNFLSYFGDTVLRPLLILAFVGSIVYFTMGFPASEWISMLKNSFWCITLLGICIAALGLNGKERKLLMNLFKLKILHA